MPRVPVLSGPSVNEAALPGARVTTDAPNEAFGVGGSAAGLNQAITQLGGTAGEVFQREKDKADRAFFDKMRGDFLIQENDLLRNEKDGAFTKRGENAIGILPEYTERHSKITEEYMKRANNDSQKAMFNDFVQKRRAAFTTTLQDYSSQQYNDFRKESHETLLRGYHEDLANNYQNPEAFKQSMKDMEGAIRVKAFDDGIGNEAANIRVQEAKSKAHSNVINRMLSNEQDLAAKGYFESIKDQITGTDKIAIENNLKEGSTRGEAQRLSDQYWSQAKGDVGKALDLTKDIENEKVRTLARQKIRELNSDYELAKKQTQDRNYEDVIRQVGNRTGAAARLAIPPAQWNAMSPEQQSAVMRRAEDVPNNSKVWLDFVAMDAKSVASLSRADFESKYWQHFDKEHRAKAETQWNAAMDARKNPKKEEQFKSIKSDKEMIFDAIKQSGVFDTTDTMAIVAKDDKKAALYDQAENEIEAAFEAYYNQFQKNPDDKVKRQIIGEKLKKRVFLDQWFTDPKKPAGMVKDDEKGSAYVPMNEIPAGEQTAIKNIFKSKGKRVSDDKLQRAYAAYLMGDRNLLNSILEEK